MAISSLGNWKSRRSKSVRLGSHSYVPSHSPLNHDDHPQQHYNNELNHQNKWMQMLWRRLTGSAKKTKKKSSWQSSYDHESYLQNFDQGTEVLVEPEYLQRSFSAKYANPHSPFLLRTTQDFIRINESG